MSDIAEALMAAAAGYGLPKHVVKAIGELVIKAGYLTTGHSDVAERLVMRVMEDKILADRRRRYRELLETIELPPDGFTLWEQARVAANLSQTYRLLRLREDDAGVEPTPKDRRVSEAERLKTAFHRSQPLIRPADHRRRYKHHPAIK